MFEFPTSGFGFRASVFELLGYSFEIGPSASIKVRPFPPSAFLRRCFVFLQVLGHIFKSKLLIARLDCASECTRELSLAEVRPREEDKFCARLRATQTAPDTLRSALGAGSRATGRTCNASEPSKFWLQSHRAPAALRSAASSNSRATKLSCITTSERSKFVCSNATERSCSASRKEGSLWTPQRVVLEPGAGTHSWHSC